MTVFVQLILICSIVLLNYCCLGMLADGDLDERAIDAIKEFSVENALAVLNEFKNSNLEHVSNKSAFLCGVMKTYRQKNKMGASSESSASANKRVGPDETKIKVDVATLENLMYLS